jgi:hypothetical protein
MTRTRRGGKSLSKKSLSTYFVERPFLTLFVAIRRHSSPFVAGVQRIKRLAQFFKLGFLFLKRRSANSRHLGLAARYGRGRPRYSWIRNGVQDLGNAAANQYAIGYNHALSKRTNLYSKYWSVKNGTNSAGHMRRNPEQRKRQRVQRGRTPPVLIGRPRRRRAPLFIESVSRSRLARMSTPKMTFSRRPASPCFVLVWLRL